MAVILPNFYKDFIFNNLVFNKFFHSPVKFTGVWGSFPFSFYGHDVNNNQDKNLTLFDNMMGCIKAYDKMSIILLDFSNPYLNEKDYHSRLLKLQFSSFGNFENVFFIISQKGLFDYIKSNYPSAKIIVDLDYCDFEIDEKNVDGIISWDRNKLLNYNNLQNKILRKSLYNCHTCHYYKQCLKVDTLNAMNFSEDSSFYKCTFKDKNEIKVSDLLDDEEIPYILLDSPKESSAIFYDYLIDNLEGNND